MIADSALPIVAIIIFVTGAGGVFGNVLVESKIGNALSQSLTAMGMLIVAAFVISSALRAAQGSSDRGHPDHRWLAGPTVEAGWAVRCRWPS